MNLVAELSVNKQLQYFEEFVNKVFGNYFWDIFSREVKLDELSEGTLAIDLLIEQFAQINYMRHKDIIRLYHYYTNAKISLSDYYK